MKQQQEDLKVIREMMEKSTKCPSLSGWSGITAGLTAILGACYAYGNRLGAWLAGGYFSPSAKLIFWDALIVLVVSIGLAIFFSARKARRSGQKLNNLVTRRILYALAVPLVTGGIFCLIHLLRGDVYTVISATLLFYGVALVSASRYTYGEVHYLGLTEIVLGLLAALFGRHGILFWTLGFGVCHIVYGIIMYYKYDRQ